MFGTVCIWWWVTQRGFSPENFEVGIGWWRGQEGKTTNEKTTAVRAQSHAAKLQDNFFLLQTFYTFGLLFFSLSQLSSPYCIGSCRHQAHQLHCFRAYKSHSPPCAVGAQGMTQLCVQWAETAVWNHVPQKASSQLSTKLANAVHSACMSWVYGLPRIGHSFSTVLAVSIPSATHNLFVAVAGKYSRITGHYRVVLKPFIDILCQLVDEWPFGATEPFLSCFGDCHLYIVTDTEFRNLCLDVTMCFQGLYTQFDRSLHKDHMQGWCLKHSR